MPIPKDYADVLTELVARTREEQVNWKPDSPGASVDIDDSIIEIWGGTDEDTGTSFVAFALKDKEGKILDTWAVDDGAADYAFMEELLGNAKRQSLGIPDRLKHIRAILGNTKKKVGTPPDDDLPF